MASFRYTIFGLPVECEIELPGLPATDLLPEVAIRLATVPFVEHKASESEEYVFNPISAAFRIRNGEEILVDPYANGSPDAVRVLLLGRVIACLLRQRGWLPLHASAVLVERQAILFMGASGTGKSTMAAAFHASGCRVIADDVGAVRIVDGRCIAQPGLPQVRLLDKSRTLLQAWDAKARFQLDKYTYDLGSAPQLEQVPIERIYVLEHGREIQISPVMRTLGAALMNRHSFVKRRKSQFSVLSAHFKHCATIANSVAMRHLVRPHSLSLMPDVIQAVLRDLAQK